MTILGPDGLPARRAPVDMSDDQAAPSLTGVRNAWQDGVAANLTPRRLAQILRAADMGDGHDYLTLAEEMEEREPQYGTVLGIRKRAVQGLPIQIDAASDDPADVALADEVRDLFDAPQLQAAIGDMLDALGKGYSVVEINWETSAARWTPREFIWRDPRFFQPDRLTGREIRLRVDGAIDGEPLPANKYVVHVPRLKSGMPLRGGLARFAMWSFMFKSYTIRDWASFLETYGMPIRLGRYGMAASKDDQQKLLRAVRSIASDAAAIIPDTMTIDFQSADKGSGSGGAVFSSFAEYLDGALTKIVLGQTQTTDKGSNRAQAQVHDGVRKDVALSDCKQLAMTLKRDVVMPFVTLNHGPRQRYPNVRIVLPDNTDITVMSEALEKLVPLGLKVQMSSVRDKLGFGDPEQGADLLAAPAPSPALPPPAMNRSGCPCCAGRLAYNRAGATVPDELDALGAHYAADWEPQLGPMLAPLFEAAAAATSLEELRDKLPELYDKMDTGPFERRLRAATAIARGLGDAGG